LVRGARKSPRPRRRRWLQRRGRLLAGAGLGIAAGAAAAIAGASPPAAALTGWNLGALVYLALSWRLFLRAREAEVRRRAAEEDESRGGVLALVIAAMVASVAAIVWLLMTSRSAAAIERQAAPAMAVATLVISWLTLQTVFVLHYAHRHFAAEERKGEEGGFGFPGEPARTYQDFVYLSFCIGATFQVSDPEVRRSSLRNLVAAHSAIAYFYNTAILALGINIVAGLIGR
jgi:uncharacterized membrane protein